MLWVLSGIICPIPVLVMLLTKRFESYSHQLSCSHTVVCDHVLMSACFVSGRQRLCSWLWGGKKNKARRAIFLPLCKQLAASHACTINGQLIGNNHFYLSKFKIGSYPWNKQLLVEPSGNVASMLQAAVDQCFPRGGPHTVHNCWQALVEAQHSQINHRC